MKKLLSLFFVITLFMLTACSKSSSPTGPAGEFPVTFKSTTLEDAVRSEIGKPTGTIYQSDVNNITYLSISYETIDDVSGIEALKNLETLYICGSGSDIRDVTPISRLANLKELHLGQNVNLTNLESLANCLQLKELYLNHCELTDIKFLNNFRSLIHLELKENYDLESLDGIQGLSRLEYLHIKDCNVSDLTPLRNLTHLNDLRAPYNNISDLSVCLTMPGFKNGYLCLYDNNFNNEAYKVIERLEANGAGVDY